MNADDRIRLRHMLDAALEAVEFLRAETRESLSNDRKLALALVKDIEIIGEAASKITEEGHALLPQVPWPQIISMRNRLIHAYFDIDLEQVWSTVKQDLPPLIAELEILLSSDAE